MCAPMSSPRMLRGRPSMPGPTRSQAMRWVSRPYSGAERGRLLVYPAAARCSTGRPGAAAATAASTTGAQGSSVTSRHRPPSRRSAAAIWTAPSGPSVSAAGGSAPGMKNPVNTAASGAPAAASDRAAANSPRPRARPAPRCPGPPRVRRRAPVRRSSLRCAPRASSATVDRPRVAVGGQSADRAGFFR